MSGKGGRTGAKNARESEATQNTQGSSFEQGSNGVPGLKSRMTWRRSIDFTLTVVGYTVGVHDFWRFPFLCHKYGATFFIPFFTFVVIFYFPSVFMEFTIGQYHAVGSTEAFGLMAPILTGVSYILAWNSLTSCWLYAMMISWSRLYSDDATSCQQGWRTCSHHNYYSTISCFTGPLERNCEKIPGDYVFYNYSCYTLDHVCKQLFNGTAISGTKLCFTKEFGSLSVFDKDNRSHATREYFYGGLCGLKRVQKGAEPNKDSGFSHRHGVHEDDDDEEGNDNDQKSITQSKEIKFVKDVASASEGELFVFAFTTFIIIGFFLHEGLLAVSFVTYLLNAVPFVALCYFTVLALRLEHAIQGMAELKSLYNLSDLLSPDIWVDAALQIIACIGIGNGVLINLSTFNKADHNYILDTSIAALLNCICSTATTLICFCTIGHVTAKFKLNIPFEEFIESKSAHSSLEFGYIIYTQFLGLIGDESIAILMFFFMITSFSMDSALRLVQNTLDAVTFMFPRLRRHRLASLIGICLFGFAAVLPMTRNGGVLLFWEYEYFMIKFVWPIIALIQIIGVTWIYKTSRALDNAEQMGVIPNSCFRIYITVCLQYIVPLVLIFVLGYNSFNHKNIKFINHIDRPRWNEVFGWILTATPVILFGLACADKFLLTDRKKWPSLFHPSSGRSMFRSMRRRTGLSVTNYGVMSLQTGSTPSADAKKTDKAIAQALKRWRGADGGRRFGRKGTDQTQPDNKVQETEKVEETDESPILPDISPTPSMDTSLNQLLRKSQAQSATQKEDELRVKNDKWKILWKKIIQYLKKWPGRLDEIEDEEALESDDESFIYDDEQEEEEPGPPENP